MDAKPFAEVAEKHTARLPLREIAVVPHATHLGNIILSTAYIVPFLKNYCKIIAPSLSFKLRDPKLDDFEKLQFIGKGSFGRVYLVKHRVSEKYFAMKVLNKTDIVEGMI